MQLKVLMVSPHFPPDTSAGTHRVRLLAPHVAKFGWEPTVVTVDPRDYESRLDPGLAELVPKELRVVRSRAWPVGVTRRVGVGDLGLRAMRGLYQTCAELLTRERFDDLPRQTQDVLACGAIFGISFLRPLVERICLTRSRAASASVGMTAA